MQRVLNNINNDSSKALRVADEVCEKRITIFATDCVRDKSIALFRIWGLTLLERCLLVADKLSCEKVEIITDCKEQIEAFVSSSKPSGLEIDIKENPAQAEGDVILHANCLYDIRVINGLDDIEKSCYFKVNSREDLAEAKKVLWGKNSKPPTAKIFLRIINRPIGKQILKLLANTKITPNQISFISLIIGIIGAVCLTFNIYAYTVVGALLIELAMCLDCVDGPLSRLKNSGSDFGKWFDIVSDNIKISFVCLGLTIGLFRYYGYYWIWIAGFLVQSGFLVHAIIWLTGENMGEKKEDNYKLPNGKIKSFKNTIDYVFVFFRSIENFYAMLLLGSIFKLNLIVLTLFAVFLNLKIIYNIVVTHLKSQKSVQCWLNSIITK